MGYASAGHVSRLWFYYRITAMADLQLFAFFALFCSFHVLHKNLLGHIFHMVQQRALTRVAALFTQCRRKSVKLWPYLTMYIFCC